MSNFDPEDFLASPIDRLFNALEDVSKLELLREIEKLKANNARLDRHVDQSGVTAEQANIAMLDLNRKVNQQIEANNRLDKQLSFERIRRAQAEKLLDNFDNSNDTHILVEELLKWKSWRAEQVRQQEIG